VLINVVTFKEG